MAHICARWHPVAGCHRSQAQCSRTIIGALRAACCFAISRIVREEQRGPAKEVLSQANQPVRPCCDTSGYSNLHDMQLVVLSCSDVSFCASVAVTLLGDRLDCRTARGRHRPARQAVQAGHVRPWTRPMQCTAGKKLQVRMQQGPTGTRRMQLGRRAELPGMSAERGAEERALQSKS